MAPLFKFKVRNERKSKWDFFSPVFFFMYFESPYSKKGIDSAYNRHRGFGFVLKTD